MATAPPTPLAPLSRTEEHAAQQAPRREREHRTRVAAVHFAAQRARSSRRAARDLGIASRTLAHWRRTSVQGQLTPRSRGRPCREPTMEQRAVVTALLEECGPRLGVPTLRTYCQETPRCVLTYLVHEHRRQFQEEHRQMLETLYWKRPGAVWAVDHSEPPQPIDGLYTQILAVRDLASGLQLAWTPVADATATEALLVLEGLVLRHGAPLVLKSDNGPAFKSEAFDDWLKRWQIVPLLSPVRMPRYNGACEAGIGAAKRRTEYLAARRGCHLAWTASDLYAAQQWANEEHYPGGCAAGTPAGRFAARSPVDLAERDIFSSAVLQYERDLNEAACIAGDALTDTLEAIHHRRAVRHVLVERGYLDITRRSVPQPLPPRKCARIT